MTLLLVRDGAHEVWVAAHIGEDLYVYDAHTGAFHRNDALWRDFYAMHSRELIYEVIDPPTALAKIAVGVGDYDSRVAQCLLAEHRADPAPLAAADVLGDPRSEHAPCGRCDGVQRRMAKGEAVHSIRAMGLALSPEGAVDATEYADGRISLDEYGLRTTRRR